LEVDSHFGNYFTTTTTTVTVIISGVKEYILYECTCSFAVCLIIQIISLHVCNDT